MAEATWSAPAADCSGDLSTAERDRLPDSVFAFPAQRKEPLCSESHVRNAVARFNQVEGVSDAERDVAWANIRRAAAHYGVHVRETSWRELRGM